ncbi:MAG: hypothetical protein ACHQDC_06230 [Acidimicrobiales bacterium]
MLIATLAALAALIADLSGISSGDDGVGYRAIADSILDGRGLGYFLERPVTIWPPLWPGLMAAVAKITPLDTTGAAILLNAVMLFLAVMVGNRLLRTLVNDDRLVLAGTAVIGLGGVSIGFANLLMPDFAFAVVIMVWMILLIRFHRTGSMPWLIGAAALVWVAFGLRYVGVVLVGTGGLWLLFDQRRTLAIRFRNGIVYGLVAILAPAAWMARNHSVDGTLTGVRWSSARGLLGNGFDALATLGKMVLPGVLSGADELWAMVGLAALATGALLGWKVLRAAATPDNGPIRRFIRGIGSPVGIVFLHVGLYLAYMLYFRTTTALNVLDLRLLNAVYFGFIVLAMVLADRLEALGPRDTNPWFIRARAAVTLWAVANVAIGVFALVSFNTGGSLFPGNYNNDTFEAVRQNAALDALPPGCRVYSNLPNALYPRVGAKWSPMEFAIESDEATGDLEKLLPTLASDPACLVWIDEEPVYGTLWSRDELSEQLTLRQLAHDDDVTVYEMEPKAP